MFSKLIKELGEQLSFLLSSSTTGPAVKPDIRTNCVMTRLYLRGGDIIDHPDTDIKIDVDGNVFTKVKGRWVNEPDIVGVIYGPAPL